MDPSEEKKQADTPIEKKKFQFRLPALIVLLIIALSGAGFYYYSSTKGFSSLPAPSTPDEILVVEDPITKDTISEEKTVPPKPTPEDTPLNKEVETLLDTLDTPIDTVPEVPMQETVMDSDISEVRSASPITPVTISVKTPEATASKEVSICDKPALQLNDFYTHLDSQAYMTTFKIDTSSKNHFTALIYKLLANPPQVTRESDDLYTILKNTAHFFRISGKDNILMLKGILDNEKGSVEQILADYYTLITTPECETNTYTEKIDNDALYEYACFFLNTMGGRLYLFRRDSLSRMVVTYYAILLVERANIQNNNRHGIALRPVVNMLISEMEAGGSALKHSDAYLDSLYDLKEKYQ